MWFMFALLSGVANAGANVSRRMTGQTAQPVMLSWWTSLVTLPVAGSITLFTGGPHFRGTDWIAPAVISAILATVVHILVFQAYKHSEASVVSPLANLLPALLLISSFIMFREVPSLGGVIGVLLVVAGMYYSSVSNRHQVFHPLQAILKQKGARYMLIVVLIWAVGTNVDQIAVKSGAEPAWLVFFVSALSFCITSAYVAYWRRQQAVRRRYHVWKRWKWHIIAIVLFGTTSVILQLHAVAMAETAYVVAVKRSDVIFTVLASGLLLNEKNIFRRFTGALIGAAGIALIALTR